MGGNPPLGYDVANRKLVVNLAEATTARLIFQRYLDLGCPRLSDMAGRGVVSKLRTFGTGEHRGGWPMGRKRPKSNFEEPGLCRRDAPQGCLLSGEHNAIVPTALFEAVQKRLAQRAPPLSGNARLEQNAPYASIL